MAKNRKKNEDDKGCSAADLASNVKFAPDTGHILLFDQRMLLMHGFSVGEMRRELIASIGLDKARSVFTRLGYQQGIEDCKRIRSQINEDVELSFNLGVRLREIEGFVKISPLTKMSYSEDKPFYGDYLWSSSWEAEAHLTHVGLSGEPACWMMAGYASGYCTNLVGIPILWREVECVAMGHHQCRVVGKPADMWDDADHDLSFMKIEDFVDTPLKASSKSGVRHSKAAVGTSKDNTFGELIGASAGFNAVVQLLKKVAPTDATVLFLGESGVGKERFSKTLHSIGPRAEAPFVSINCAAIPHDLVEAELFGVEKGAFTNAMHSRPGRFERANGGTLFLDEIGSLPLSAQGKLLRALQEQEIERVGDVRARQVDVRVVAATNQDLRTDVAEGRFRADLFYRLNVFPIEIPPLRERREDIPLLLNVFLERYCRKIGKKITGISTKAFDALWSYHWPGNVRELENMVERAVIMADDDGRIDIHHLFHGGETLGSQLFSVSPVGRLVTDLHKSDTSANPKLQGLLDTILGQEYSFEQLESLLVDRALEISKGNQSEAARILKLGRGQMQYRMRKVKA